MKLVQTSTTMALGCSGTLMLLGSFAVGLYVGRSQARGEPVDPNMSNILKFGPSTVGLVYGGITSVAQLSEPENLESVVESAPLEARAQMKGCAQGCAPIIGGVIGLTMFSLANYVGYAVGSTLGRSS